MVAGRWDVVLEFLTPPASAEGERCVLGPLIVLGASPGPGGLRLDAHRGLDPRHAVLQSYDGGTVSVGPVGAGPVRVSPHDEPDWERIPPIRGPVYLSPGDVIHLGPATRGVSLRFVRSVPLSTWEAAPVQASADPRGRDVRGLVPDGQRPWWFLPSMVMVGVAVAVGVLLPFCRPPDVPPLGPIADGAERYDHVESTEPLQPAWVSGLEGGFYWAVVGPNADAAQDDALRERRAWDDVFLDRVARSTVLHARARRFWARLEAVRAPYAQVVLALREAGLPEVFAAIPYTESAYTASARSSVCAGGWWQFMPEVAHRVGLEVSGCALRGSEERWSPTERVVPPRARRVYIDPTTGSCRLDACEVDTRTDLDASTRAAIGLLREAWEDPELRASGAAVQLTILSHNMGYDDARYAEGRRSGALWAWRRYADGAGSRLTPDIYGQLIRCPATTAGPDDPCDDGLPAESQHYAYNVVAQHLLAVCYYAKNHPEDAAFAPWVQMLQGDGFCRSSQVATPLLDEVRRWGPGAG